MKKFAVELTEMQKKQLYFLVLGMVMDGILHNPDGLSPSTLNTRTSIVSQVEEIVFVASNELQGNKLAGHQPDKFYESVIESAKQLFKLKPDGYIPVSKTHGPMMASISPKADEAISWMTLSNWQVKPIFFGEPLRLAD